VCVCVCVRLCVCVSVCVCVCVCLENVEHLRTLTTFPSDSVYCLFSQTNTMFVPVVCMCVCTREHVQCGYVFTSLHVCADTLLTASLQLEWGWGECKKRLLELFNVFSCNKRNPLPFWKPSIFLTICSLPVWQTLPLGRDEEMAPVAGHSSVWVHRNSVCWLIRASNCHCEGNGLCCKYLPWICPNISCLALVFHIELTDCKGIKYVRISLFF